MQKHDDMNLWMVLKMDPAGSLYSRVPVGLSEEHFGLSAFLEVVIRC